MDLHEQSWIKDWGRMTKSVRIVEYLRRSEQGLTRPFICRGDDGEIWYVKGRGASRRSQVCEWLAGNLGRAMGLPLAHFVIADVPEELADPTLAPELRDLGVGPAFASKRCGADELTATTAALVPSALRRDLFAFDWWVRNQDRTLTEKGGNPNLLWLPADHQLAVIDHNQAFDPEFSRRECLQNHVFAGEASALFGDMFQRLTYHDRFDQILRSWPDYCAAIPEEWFYADDEMTVRADFSLEAMYEILIEHRQEDFWSVP